MSFKAALLCTSATLRLASATLRARSSDMTGGIVGPTRDTGTGGADGVEAEETRDAFMEAILAAISARF